MSGVWRNCSACKKPIALGADYWVCSVSTCNRARDPYVFCTLACWDSHVPTMNHRDAWAEERVAPRTPEPSRAEGPRSAPSFSSVPARGAAVSSEAADPRRRIVRTEAAPASHESDEILIIASRLKDFIREQSGMNTSADVMKVLSDEVRYRTLQAIRTAERAGRRTVMARDFED